MMVLIMNIVFHVTGSHNFTIDGTTTGTVTS